MDLIGLAGKIAEAEMAIDAGRKGFAIRGKEQEGRISYEIGIDKARSFFEKAQASTDPLALILAEYTFITQELQLCAETDVEAFGSLTLAKQSFDDAFLALQVVENGAVYREADKLFPHRAVYRFGGYPKDAFHIACMSHKTRLQNILRAPGIDPIEKALLKSGYTAKQKKALAS